MSIARHPHMKNRTHSFGPFETPRLEPLEPRNLLAATPISYVDGDGTTVKISLSGNGAMVLNGADLIINGADQGTKLTIKNKGGNGRTTLGSIIVNGALKGISAKTTDLTGDISILGSVRTLDLGNLLPGAQKTLTIGGTANAKEAKFTFGRVVDLSIDSGTPISSLTVTDWDDTDGNDLIEVPRLKKVKSKEDFAPGGILISDEEGKGALGKVTVKGGMSGAWYVDGAASGITTGSTGPDFRLNVRGKLGNIKANQNFSGIVAAYNVGSVTISGSAINAVILAGADLGTDMAFGGTGEEADLFFSGKFSKLTVKGSATNSTFGAGLDPANSILGDGDDFVTGKKASSFGSIKVTGNVNAGSQFAAGKFSSIKLTGTKIDPNGDPRILMASTVSDETPPVITARLRTNTGDPDDDITSDPTIVGRVIDLGSISSFRYGIDGDDLVDFNSIRNLIEPDGTFELLRSHIEKSNKGPLSVGLHTINFVAKDEIGNTSPIFTVAFVFAP